MGGTLESSGPHSLLWDQVVLISGGTAGLGAGIARAAAREGAIVAVTGRRREPGEALAAELTAGGTKALFVQADVADVAQARACAAAVIMAFGRVDSLVNAAGLTARGTLLDTTPELFDAHIAVNLKAPFFLMQAVVADLVARKAPGTIVNIISTSAHAGQPYLAPYVAAKAGLAGLTRNAAHAHRWDRIRINGLNIGWTDTGGEDATQRRFHGAGDDWRAKASASLPMGKLGQVGEIAEFVVFLLSDRSGVVTGSVIDWDQNVLGGMDLCGSDCSASAGSARFTPRSWPACQPSGGWYSATRCRRWPNRSPGGRRCTAPGTAWRPDGRQADCIARREGSRGRHESMLLSRQPRGCKASVLCISLWTIYPNTLVSRRAAVEERGCGKVDNS